MAAVVGLGLYAASVAIAGPGTAKILSPRPFGLMGIVLVAWFLGGGLIGRRWAYWVVAFAIVLTLLSLSRSALAAEFVLVALAWFNLRNFRGWLIAIGAGVVVDGGRARGRLPVRAAAPPLLPRRHPERRRLQHQRDRPRRAVVGQLGLVQAAAADRCGAGASDRLTAALPGRGAGHPHNDYLRILVDYGIVGFVLWMSAYLALLRLTWKRWQAVRGTRVYAEHVHSAAFLVLVGIGSP